MKFRFIITWHITMALGSKNLNFKNMIDKSQLPGIILDFSPILDNKYNLNLISKDSLGIHEMMREMVVYANEAMFTLLDATQQDDFISKFSKEMKNNDFNLFHSFISDTKISVEKGITTFNSISENMTRYFDVISNQMENDKIFITLIEKTEQVIHENQLEYFNKLNSAINLINKLSKNLRRKDDMYDFTIDAILDTIPHFDCISILEKVLNEFQLISVHVQKNSSYSSKIFFEINQFMLENNEDHTIMYRQSLEDLNSELVIMDQERLVFISLAIRVNDEIMGFINISSPRYWRPSSYEMNFFSSITNILGLYMEREILQKQQQEITTKLYNNEYQLEKFLLALDKSNTMVMFFDFKGRIEFVNSSFAEILGYKESDIIGMRLEYFIHGKNNYRNSKIVDLFHYNKKLRKSITESIDFKKRDGDKLKFITSITPVYMPDGKLASFIGLLQDITNISEIEYKLRKAQKMEALGRFSRGIVHDLKGIMQVMSANIDFIEMNDEQRIHSREIVGMQECIEQTKILTNFLLNFGKRQEKKLCKFNPIIEVRQIEDWLNHILGKENKLLLDIRCEDLTIFGDPENYKQTIINLTMNAKDAIVKSNGKVRILIDKLIVENSKINTLDTQVQELILAENIEQGNFLSIKFSDNGMGMDHSTLEHLFEPFYTTKSSGTGIGLSLVYSFIKEINGYISANSELNIGTTFCLLMPIEEEEDK